MTNLLNLESLLAVILLLSRLGRSRGVVNIHIIHDRKYARKAER